MRPIKLSLTAFGPFAGTQVIDFRRAYDSRLFGIYGAMGAGKTSILDGLCFALFGESSGEERKGEDLRSHHAVPEVETEVRLIFELGERRYHLVRRPRQMVRAKRGGGLTERVHWAALYDVGDLAIDAIDADNPGLALEERKVEAVADRLTTILNYTAAQFRQVVLLPQGEFRRLLTAKSDDRSAVLRGLFDVNLYERFVERLKSEASALHAEIEQQRATVLGRLRGHDVEDVDGLNALIVSKAEELDARTAERDDALAARDLSRTELQSGQAIATIFAEHDAADQAIQGLEEHAPQVDGLRARHIAAQRAAGCLSLDERAAETRETLGEALKALEDQRQIVESACETDQSAKAALATSEALNDERERDNAEVTRLIGYRDRLEATAGFRAKAEAAAVAHNTAVAALKDAQAAHDTAAIVLQDARQAEQAATVRAQTLSSLKLRLKTLEQEEGVSFAHTQQFAVVQNLATQNESARAEQEAARTHLDEAIAQEAKAVAALAAAQAIHLARTLKSGEPCPVCGGLDHPAPARGSDASAGLDRAWRERVEARANADTAARSAGERAAKVSGELSEANRRLASLPTNARDYEVVVDERRGVQDELAATEQELGGGDAQLTVRAAEGALGKAAQNLTEARSTHAEADRAAASAKAALDAALSDVPVALRLREALESTLLLASQAATQGRERHDALVTAERTTAQAYQTANSDLGHALREEAKLRSELERHVDRFEQALAAVGFDLTSYAAAKADVEGQDELQRQIEEHDRALAAAKDRLARAAAVLGEGQRPDLLALQNALDAADGVLVAAEQAAVAVQLGLTQCRTTVSAILEAHRRLNDDEARYATVGELAQLTDGRNPQRLRLRDFAIAATFDAVLEAANVRFARMSRNRFTLLRKIEGGDGRARSGLEIEVYDAHTDQRRDAHTLSGGEGFLASLSLALGLSDVVQAEAGGVKLDAIFIDEGFGHLDPETLDVALATLRDLVGGDRSVGIISHVEAVKEQIPAGFDVLRGIGGSNVVERQIG